MEPSVEDTELTTLIIEGNQRREARFTEKVEGWEAAGHFTPREFFDYNPDLRGSHA